MPRRSKIAQLDPQLRKEIDELLGQGVKLEDIVAHMRKLGVDLSKSGVHRYSEKIEVVGERMRRSREIAEALATRFGDAPEDKVLQMNIQFLHSAIMDIMATSDESGAPVQLNPLQAMALAKAVGELARASKTDADRLLKMRKDLAEKAVKAADGAAKKTGAPGLTKDVADAIRQSVLGVHT